MNRCYSWIFSSGERKCLYIKFYFYLSVSSERSGITMGQILYFFGEVLYFYIINLKKHKFVAMIRIELIIICVNYYVKYK